VPTNTTCTAANLPQRHLIKANISGIPGTTYAAVAENISIGFPLVKRPKIREKREVKRPINPSRFKVLSTEYSTTVDVTGRMEAIAVITSMEIRSNPV
jgi:hypothetical protein